MFESWFLGPALVALIGTAVGVAIGASWQARIVRKPDAEAGLADPRRVFGRKRPWHRAPRLVRRLRLMPLR